MSGTITTDIGQAAQVYAKGIPLQLLDAGVAEIAAETAAPLKEATERETPVDTGALSASSATSVIEMAGAGAQAVMQLTQDAESLGSGMGVFYGFFVRSGHRIVAWGHDTGRYQPPNRYDERGMANAMPALETILTAGNDRLLTTCAAVLR